MQLSQQQGPAKLELAAVAPDLGADLDINLGPGGGGQGGDGSPVPLVRVNPQYPARAMQRGVEGWVQLRFTVSAAGTVKAKARASGFAGIRVAREHEGSIASVPSSGLSSSLVY